MKPIPIGYLTQTRKYKDLSQVSAKIPMIPKVSFNFPESGNIESESNFPESGIAKTINHFSRIWKIQKSNQEEIVSYYWQIVLGFITGCIIAYGAVLGYNAYLKGMTALYRLRFARQAEAYLRLVHRTAQIQRELIWIRSDLAGYFTNRQQAQRAKQELVA